MKTILTYHQIPIPILAKGKGWLAVDKPCGLSIHNDPGADLCSILKACIGTKPLFHDESDYDPRFGFHAVHRLDKQTSGVILLACRPDILRYYSEQFESRTVQKRYVALLHGKLTDPGDNDSPWGMWDWALSKDAGGRKSPVGKGPRLKSQTRFRMLRHSLHYTLVECEPLTGRKHQIRRHAKLAGHPVVGDPRYGTPRSLKYLGEHCGFDRLGLHAMSLTIRPPDKKEAKTIQSSGIPEDIRQLIDNDPPP